MDRRRVRVNLFSLLGLLALGALVWITPETREMAERIRQHFLIRFQKAEPVERQESTPEETPEEVKEEPAAEQAPPPHVEKNDAGEYVPEPGYTWVSPEPGNFEVRWCPGCRHRDSPNLFASAEEGQWHPGPGYDWADPEHDLSLVWKPGLRHPQHEHVLAAEEEAQWVPEAGYHWADKDDPDDFRVLPGPPE